MEERGRVKLIACREGQSHLCACAARISTTTGGALELFERPEEGERDRKLLENVLRSGHRSVLEHAVFTMAFCGVSVVAEQFMIEFRLGSYTVKSRRYVDFSGRGAYVPRELTASPRGSALYREYVERRFADYAWLLEQGAEKEDARFVLPYGFRSDFYCTMNARELIHVTRELLYGRGSALPELRGLGEELAEQLTGQFPALSRELEGEAPARLGEAPLPCRPERVEGDCRLLSFSHGAEERMALARQLCRYGREVPAAGEALPPTRRELELVWATFLLKDLSLPGITHITRHRMQSIVIPPVWKALAGRYVVPRSIARRPELLERYQAAFSEERAAVEELRELGFGEETAVYLCLSGSTMDVLTAMNGRELELFFRLRCCNRAQWEIREMAGKMLSLCREALPQVFCKMGPSCFTEGACPEGKLSCGRTEETRRRFEGEKL